MTFSDGPCDDWPVSWTCDVSTYSQEATGMALSMATKVLWALSGRRYGTCSTTLRPCRPSCYQPWPQSHPLLFPWSEWGGSPSNWDASYWFSSECGQCSGGCSCGEVPTVLLPSLCNAVTQVKVNGVVLDPSAYRLDDNRLLVRTDGYRWPRCNNLRLADTEQGTWSVTAAYGLDVPSEAAGVVGELACQVLRARNGADCRLPMQLQSLIRQGVTITFPDINAAVEAGRTGVYLVDLWLAAVNPNRLQQRSRVYAVDRVPPRRAGS
jgi:hypothetical protein